MIFTAFRQVQKSQTVFGTRDGIELHDLFIFYWVRVFLNCLLHLNQKKETINQHRKYNKMSRSCCSVKDQHFQRYKKSLLQSAFEMKGACASRMEVQMCVFMEIV